MGVQEGDSDLRFKYVKKKKISSALDTRLFFFGFKTGSTIYKCDVNEYSINT